MKSYQRKTEPYDGIGDEQADKVLVDECRVERLRLQRQTSTTQKRFAQFSSRLTNCIGAKRAIARHTSAPTTSGVRPTSSTRPGNCRHPCNCRDVNEYFVYNIKKILLVCKFALYCSYARRHTNIEATRWRNAATSTKKLNARTPEASDRIANAVCSAFTRTYKREKAIIVIIIITH